MVQRFGLGTQSQVIEIASNDGYSIRACIEPALNRPVTAPCATPARQPLSPVLAKYWNK